jgi:diaminopimelate decarboxylase
MRLAALIDNYQTPFYFYSLKELGQTVDEIRSAFPISNFQLLFATMANDNRQFLSFIGKHGIGACVNSIKHLNLALSCGIPIDKIQFTSTGIDSKDMLALNERGITVNFDSISQLGKWFSLPKELPAGVRINTASLVDGGGMPDRLGIDCARLPEAIALARSKNRQLNGVHIYVGTNYKTHLEMLPPLEAFFELAATVPDLEYVNIGGGIGVNYLDDQCFFDLNAYGLAVCELVKKLRRDLNKDIRVVFEPGRRLAASSGAFVTKITDIKSLSNTRYIIVDASVAVFPRPFHHPDSPHNVFAPFVTNDQPEIQSVVAGKTTFSKDIMCRKQLSEALQIGDVLLFDYAGAYCDSMRSKFLGQREPENIFLDA